MKTFLNLIEEIQKNGKCNLCGRCVTFCSVINNEALRMDNDGWPYVKDINRCIECGLCYRICSQSQGMAKNTRKEDTPGTSFNHSMKVLIARAKNKIFRQHGTDGGVVSSILARLFDTGKIDGAIVSKNTRSGRISFFAQSKEDILQSAGDQLNRTAQLMNAGREYSTFSQSTHELKNLTSTAFNRVAFVGVPCQINTVRKMQSMALSPSDRITYCFGVFCSGNYYFSPRFLKELEKKYTFKCEDIKKINIKEAFILTLSNDKQLLIPLNELDAAKRLACDFCDDFSAGHADISFGGTGADHGWTSVIARTDIGESVLSDALNHCLETFHEQKAQTCAASAEKKIKALSTLKKEKVDQSKKSLENSGIKVIF